MKTKTFFSLIALFVISTAIFIACEKTSNEVIKDIFSDEYSQQLVDNFTSLENQFQKDKVIFQATGRVKIGTFIYEETNEEIFYALLDDPEMEKDVVFYVQVKDVPLPKNLETYENAKIISLKNHLLIGDLKGTSKMIFSLENQASLGDMKNTNFTYENKDAYGISMTFIPKKEGEIVFRNLEPDAYCLCTPYSQQPPPTCSAGGSGSTSCSYGPCDDGTSCQTTCSTGYACCGCN